MTVGLLIALVALQFTPQPGTIAGTVIKAGTAVQQPLGDARLELTGAPGAPVVTRTDLNGEFAFPNLPPGQYRLTVTCDGFIRQEYGKRIVVAGGQQVGDVLFELEPAPTVTGWVLDSFGEPIANIMVEALHRSYDVRGNPRLARAASALTDDRGEYRIFWLNPGEYFFYASSALPDSKEEQPLRVVTPTYFPGVRAPDDARSLRLDIGREIRVDFRLSRRVSLWKVSGQTMNGGTSRSIAARITLTPSNQDPSFSRYRAASSATGREPGQFSILNVVPGSYVLMAKSGSGDQEIAIFESVSLRPVPYSPRTRPPEHEVSLRLAPPFSITGRLFVESREGADLGGASVALISVDPDLPSPRRVLVRPDGQLVLDGVVPGSYVLEISGLSQDLYLKAARFGDDDILEDPLTLDRPDRANPLGILLGSDGGRLEVAAYGDEGEPHAAHVVLVPDVTRRSRRDQYRVTMSGEAGPAILEGIPPGSYKLFAWEDLVPNAYLNSDYLKAYEALGVGVNIASGDNPPVSVRLIPKD